jgi:isoquinoline 1-oxidoreductase alpha subunit
MALYKLTLDDKPYAVEAEPNKPLLWVLREDLNQTQAKFGCGAGLCGACTVYADDNLVRACVYPIATAAGKKITTIAGLNDELAQKLKAAWSKYDVPQCGYCQPGFVLGAHKLLKKTPADQSPNLSEVTNLCRCGTYDRIRQAVLDVHGQASRGS